MSDPDLAPYLAVLSLTNCEASLITAGAWPGVVSIGAERGRLVAALPADPPPAARALVDQSLAQMQMNLANAVVQRDRARATLAHLADGRRAMHAYAGAAPRARFDARS